MPALLVPPPAPPPVVSAPLLPLLEVASLVEPVMVDAVVPVVALAPALVLLTAFAVLAAVMTLALVVLSLLLWAVWVAGPVPVVVALIPPPALPSVVDEPGESSLGSELEQPFRKVAARSRAAVERSIFPGIALPPRILRGDHHAPPCCSIPAREFRSERECLASLAGRSEPVKFFGPLLWACTRGLRGRR